ncbi:MAG: serine/threonine protein kinase [Verrucomicrobia bacterium]|nr:serine/threonine protein kinase [Verrucomicrobiota bacterium]
MRYKIGAQIGMGGMGTVYKAYDTQLKRNVAVKRLLSTDEASAEDVEAAAETLIKEAHTLSSLNHPNIVTVHDVGRDEKGGFVVMELLRGATLGATVEQGILMQEDFVELVTQTMDALKSAHAEHIMHRDLKPANFMVIWQASGKFQSKILDFGLAKFSATPSLQTISQDNSVLGSIDFMAPEQIERLELDERTDLYSLGCVYYYTLTGIYPFRGKSLAQVMNSHLEHRVNPLEDLRPDLAPSICQWVMWMINRDMDMRPADAAKAMEYFPAKPEAALDHKIKQKLKLKTSPRSLTDRTPIGL